MGRIPHLSGYNDARKDLMKIKNAEGEAILFNEKDFRDAIIAYIDRDMELMSNQLFIQKYQMVLKMFDDKIDNVEEKLTEMLSTKLDTLVEKMVGKSLNRIIDAEVDKRVNDKLTKIKNSL